MSRRILVAVAAVAVLATGCWTAPSDLTVGIGSAGFGSEGSLAFDDNDYFTVNATCNGNFGGCGSEWTATFHGIMTTDHPKIRYVGKNAGAGFQFILVFDLSTGSWYPIDAFRVVATSEVTVEKTLPGPSSRWLRRSCSRCDSGTGMVRVATIGNFTSTSADVFRACIATCDN